MPANLKPDGFESWPTDEIPGTETEDEAWGHARRRRNTATMEDSTSTPGTATRTLEPDQRDLSCCEIGTPQEGATNPNGATHRRRRMHALFQPATLLRCCQQCFASPDVLRCLLC